MFESTRTRCFAVADALSLLFLIESCYAFCVDGSILVLLARIAVLNSINRAYNGVRASSSSSSSLRVGASSSSSSAGGGTSSSAANDDAARRRAGKPTRGGRRLSRHFKKSLVIYLISVSYHVYYIYFSYGAFAGPDAKRVAVESSPSSGLMGTLLYSTHQLLYLTDQTVSTCFLSFFPAMQPMSMWPGGSGGGLPLGTALSSFSGGLFSQGTQMFALDVFLLLTLLAVYAALDAARVGGGVCKRWGVTIFALDDESHVSSLARRAHLDGADELLA